MLVKQIRCPKVYLGLSKRILLCYRSLIKGAFHANTKIDKTLKKGNFTELKKAF